MGMVGYIILAFAIGIMLGGLLAVVGVSFMPSDPIRPVCGVLLVGLAGTCAAMTMLDAAKD